MSRNNNNNRQGGGGGSKNSASAALNTNGGAVSAANQGGDAVLGSGKMAFLTDLHKKVLADIYRTPVENPRDEFDGLTHIPRIRETYVIDVPVESFEPNATSFNSITRAQREYQAYRDALLIASLAVTNPQIGTPAGVDLSDEMILNGNAAAAQAAPAAGGGQRHHNNNNNRYVNNDRDVRGSVENEGQDLMFTYCGQRLERVHVYIEEVCNEAGERIKYRVWLMIYDPGYNFGEAIEQVIQQNHSIYGNGNGPEHDAYISHAGVQSVAQYVERIILPYLQKGLHLGMSNELRLDFDAMIQRLQNPQNIVSAQVLSLHNPDHLVHPRKIFNKVNTFVLNCNNVCASQADPSNYFALSVDDNVLYGNGAGAKATTAAAGGDDEEGIQTAADFARIDAQADDEYLPDANPEDIDDEVASIMNMANAKTRNYVIEDVAEQQQQQQHETMGDDEDDNLLGSTSESLARINRRLVNTLQHTSDNQFLSFPKPERVIRITSANMGRRLLRMPLPHIMRPFGMSDGDDSNRGSALHSSIVRIYNDVAQNDTEERISDMSPQDRKREIDSILMELDASNRPAIDKRAYDDVNTCLSTLKRLRALQTTARDAQNVATARREVLEWLESNVESTYQSSQEDDLTRGYVYGGLLPENINGRISTSDYRDFMKRYPPFKYRMANFLERSRLNNKFNVETHANEYQVARLNFGKRAAREAWDMMTTSQDLAPSDKKMMEWFARQKPSENWGEHLDLMQNLSSYANMKIKLVSRYTHTFRGSVNHNVYMLASKVYYGCFLYDWGLRLHLIQVGRAALGKSHVYECLEVQAVPGSFEVLGHQTGRAGTGNEICIHSTVCMHEAPLALVGVDVHGREVLADPVLKDKLTRCRTTTQTFGTDKEGNRLTREFQAMHMTNTLLATNEVVPPEESPLMTRMIVLVVNNMKRPDFNAADSNTPLGDLVNSTDDMVQIHHSQLFAFYVFVTCQFIMMGVIDDVSMDAAEILVKEILNEFTRRTGIPTAQTRKRKMVMDTIKITAIENAVSLALFSALSNDVAKTKDEKTGRFSFKSFDPELIVTHVAKYLYTTDEMVVDILTLMSFMWEYEHRFSILDAIVCRRGNSPHVQPRFTRNQAPNFRLMVNPNNLGFVQSGGYNNSNKGGKFNNKARTNFPNQGQKSANMSALTRTDDTNKQQQQQQQAPIRSLVDADDEDGEDEEEDDEVDTVSQYIEDPRYVVMRGPNLSDIYSSIVAHIKHNTPSENEVQRTLRDLSKVSYEAHPAVLDLDEDTYNMPPPPAPASKQTPGMRESVSESDEPMFGGFTKNLEKGIREQTRQKTRLLRGLARRKAMLRAKSALVWKLDMEAPTEIARVVIIERDPRRNNEWQVCVLVEYLADDRHKDAMLKSIVRVMSNESIPEGGREFITSLPYVYEHTTADGTLKKEVMPQFFQILHVPRNAKRKLTATFVNIGTLDSEAFTRSSLRSQHISLNNENDYGIGATLTSKLGINFTSKCTINEYAAFRHWLRMGMAPTDDGWRKTLPEVVSYVNRNLIKSAHAMGTANLTVVANYPKDVVEDYVMRRAANEGIARGEYHDSLLHEASDVVSGIINSDKTAMNAQRSAMRNNKFEDVGRAVLSKFANDNFQIIQEPNQQRSAHIRIAKRAQLYQETLNKAKTTVRRVGGGDDDDDNQDEERLPDALPSSPRDLAWKQMQQPTPATHSFHDEKNRKLSKYKQVLQVTPSAGLKRALGNSNDGDKSMISKKPRLDQQQHQSALIQRPIGGS